MVIIGSLRQIVDYLKNNVAKGYTMDSLKWALIKQGYSRTLVEKAIDVANKEIAETVPKLIEKPMIKYEILDEDYNPVRFRKSWWKTIVDFFSD